MLASLQSSESFLTEIESNTQIVAKKTEELHHVCEGLVSEEVLNSNITQNRNISSSMNAFMRKRIEKYYLFI